MERNPARPTASPLAARTRSAFGARDLSRLGRRRSSLAPTGPLGARVAPASARANRWSGVSWEVSARAIRPRRRAWFSALTEEDRIIDFPFQKALVTGGAGFIGSHLVEGLVSMGVETISIDNYFAGKRENIPNVLALRLSLFSEEWEEEWRNLEAAQPSPDFG